MNNKKNVTVSVGNYTIVIDEPVIERLAALQECEYMVEDLNLIMDKVIELFQGSFQFGDIIPTEDCMRFVNTLHEAKKDYAFLATLNVSKVASLPQLPEDATFAS